MGCFTLEISSALQTYSFYIYTANELSVYIYYYYKSTIIINNINNNNK